jgi:cobalt-precorrin-5B (C1)-methyltransferase
MEVIASRIDHYLEARVREQDFLIGAVIFSSVHGFLAATDHVGQLKEELAAQKLKK